MIIETHTEAGAGRGSRINRGKVKGIMAAVEPQDQSGLLMGLGTPYVLTHRGRNYRTKRTKLRMNEEGDMSMQFEVCLEVV